MTFIEERESIRQYSSENPLVLGEVLVLNEEFARDASGRQFDRRRVVVGDESDRDPAMRQAYFEKANNFETMLRLQQGWEAPYLDHKGRLVISFENLAAVDLYLEDGKPTQMYEWGHQMMQAIALEPLQNLAKGGRFLTLGHLDQRTLERFTFMPDGRGLRSRQHIYSDLLVDQAFHTPGDTLRIASLGSGASVPNIEASLRIERETGKKVDWQLFDLDPRALQHAKTMVGTSPIQHSQFDFGPKSNEHPGLEFAGRSFIEARHIPNESLDGVDALGLWEYLEFNQAVTFLKMMYPKLKPGASMIVSNMLKSRPHPEYNMRAVGWPKLIMRSEQDLLDIVEAAGISTELVRITHSSDGVYAVMEIRKP